MSKTNVKEKDLHPSKSITAWDTAITDAERLIREMQQKIVRLKIGVRGFRNMRDSGEPFPGEKLEQNDAGV